MEEKMLRMMERSSSREVEAGSVLTTVMPSLIYNGGWGKGGISAYQDGLVVRMVRTLHGVLGMARTTLVVGVTRPVSWEMVTPARILIKSFP